MIRELGGWDAWILLADEEHVRALGVPPSERWGLRSGPLSVDLCRFRVPGRG